MKIKNNLKKEVMSKGKTNPKVQSANDAIIAEMLIEEMDKLSSLYNKVLEREDKIDSQYQNLEKMLDNSGQIGYYSQAGRFISSVGRALDF